MKPVNPFDSTTWVDLAREVVKVLLQESGKKTIIIQGTIAAIPIDLRVKLQD